MTAVIRLLKAARNHIAGPGMFSPGRYYKGRPDEFQFTVGWKVPDIPCCPFGAIGFAANCHPEDVDRGRAQRLAGDELSITTYKRGDGHVVTFSDTPGRNQPEIVALFDDTIARLEAAA